MAAANSKEMSDKTEERKKLEAELREMTGKKKKVFQMTREADERLRKIRVEEKEKQERLQEIIREEVERDQRERHAARLEAEVKTTKQEADLDAELKALKAENGRLKQQVEALSRDVSERRASAPEYGNEIEELELLRRQNFEQKKSMEKLKANLQRTTSYSRTQRKENRERVQEIDRLTKHLKYLEDEISEERNELKLLRRENSEQKNSLENMKAMQLTTSYSRIDRSTKRLMCLEEEISEEKKELEKLKANMQLITSFTRTQQKERRQEVEKTGRQERRIKYLEDEISAAKQLVAETHLRQLNELQSASKENKELKKTLTELSQRQQQRKEEECHQGTRN